MKKIKTLLITLVLVFLGTGAAGAYSAGPLTITISDNGREYQYTTNAETVSELLDELGIELKSEDTINKAMAYRFYAKDKIVIERVIPVTVMVDGVPRYVNSRGGRVGDFLESIAAAINTPYILDDGLSEDDIIMREMTINLISTEEKYYTVVEEIPNETEIVRNEKVAYGTENVLQEGGKGRAERIIKEVYLDGVLISSEEESYTIVKEPVKTILEKGIAKTVSTADGVIDYSYALNVRATAYTPYDDGCNGTTATGTPAVYGVLAVDPKVIPYGTKVYIPGYGYAVAEDCGGAIKGNRVDVCYETKAEAFKWGVKNITIYIL